MSSTARNADQTDAALVQRHAFAGELLAGRHVVLQGERGGAGADALRAGGCADLLVTDDLLALLGNREHGPRDAIVCLDGFDEVLDRDALLDALAREVAEGAAVIFSLRGAEGLAADAASSGTTYEQVQAALSRFPGAVLLLQTAADGSLLQPIDVPFEPPIVAELALPDRLDPAHADHYVVVAGIAGPLGGSGGRAALRAAVAPAFTRRLRSLERANAELLRVNTRLGRNLRSQGGAAAVFTLTRAQAAEEQLATVTAEAQQQVTAAAQRIAELEERSAALEAISVRADAAEREAAALADSLQASEARVTAVSERAENAERRVAEVEQRASAAERWAEELQSQLAELQSQLAELQGRRSVRAADRLARTLRR